jgi:hypothetical protein
VKCTAVDTWFNWSVRGTRTSGPTPARGRGFSYATQQRQTWKILYASCRAMQPCAMLRQFTAPDTAAAPPSRTFDGPPSSISYARLLATCPATCPATCHATRPTTCTATPALPVHRAYQSAIIRLRTSHCWQLASVEARLGTSTSLIARARSRMAGGGSGVAQGWLRNRGRG